MEKLNFWFSTLQINKNTYLIKERHHRQKNNCYLLIGKKYCALIDSGIGFFNIKKIVRSITKLPIKLFTTHSHWDHIGGHRFFDSFYIHKNEKKWISGDSPLKLKLIKKMMMMGVDKNLLPNDFDIENFTSFTGSPKKFLLGNEIFDLGGRKLKVLFTPSHSPGHICIYDFNNNFLFSGDLLYRGTLLAHYKSSDPVLFYESIKKLSTIEIRLIFPGHNQSPLEKKFLLNVFDKLNYLNKNGNLKRGFGLIKYDHFKIRI